MAHATAAPVRKWMRREELISLTVESSATEGVLVGRSMVARGIDQMIQWGFMETRGDCVRPTQKGAGVEFVKGGMN